ncbi:putative galacturonosyltransferase-like 7 [Acorus calamus]|uniref:Hexosyltransferase n=1 Tax=Acorus calamus TaxID=4465 RepID=A0AAV9EZP5_ACOCL|nr:putative galacturonosyltransferase-like 7 [Acorus calamus]
MRQRPKHTSPFLTHSPSHNRLSSEALSFRRSPFFNNADDCVTPSSSLSVCDPSLVHITITLDADYLRGSIAAVHSVLQHSRCPESVFFHFLVSDAGLEPLVRSTFPHLRFKFHFFDPNVVRGFISSSVRQALKQLLNYVCNYLVELLEPYVRRVIYLDSDLIVVDDVLKLWNTSLGSRTLGAPEYCHTNFIKYFTERFWSDPCLASAFSGCRPCYFNPGVMVIDLDRWRRFGYRIVDRTKATRQKVCQPGVDSPSVNPTDPNVSVTEAADELKTGFLVEASEEVEMDSEINRRVLVGQKSYISYESLKGDAVPCMKPGVSYYECHDLNKMWRHEEDSRRCEKRL